MAQAASQSRKLKKRRNAETMACIEARGLRKAFGTTIALDGVNLRVEEGRILGLIGPNGAGKTTALNTILGLTPYQGELKVLGRDPWTERDQLMRDVSFIADVAVLPRWMRVSQALDYVAGVHPRFDRAKAEGFLVKTNIGHGSKIRELSKGMVTQLHLALVMAMDAKLLVLDEPTLGLDILFRKQFYDSLLNDYFDRSRTIVVTTHQVDEIQDVLTDLMFIDRGRIVFECSMEEFESRYLEVTVNPENAAAARALKPIHERQVFGRSILLFDLYRAAGRRRRFPVRLSDQHYSSAGQDACPIGARSGAAARSDRHAVRHSSSSAHAYAVAGRSVLLSRRAARRTPRSQHTVLEVAAGFRSHHRAFEGEHSARCSATAHLHDHRCHAVDHAAAELRSAAGERSERREAMDTVVVRADVAAAALPPYDRTCALACANLRVAAAGFRLGAARGISMGGLTAARDRRLRKDRVPHLAFRRHDGEPHERWRRGGFHSTGYLPDGSDDTPDSGSFPEQPGSVDRLGNRRGIPRRSGPAAPLSRADLKRDLFPHPVDFIRRHEYEHRSHDPPERRAIGRRAPYRHTAARAFNGRTGCAVHHAASAGQPAGFPGERGGSRDSGPRGRAAFFRRKRDGYRGRERGMACVSSVQLGNGALAGGPRGGSIFVAGGG